MKERYIILRKVNLTMNEMNTYKTIKKLVDTNGNRQRAAIQLDISRRHVNRLIKKYKEQGKEGFSHGNKGKIPAHAFSELVKSDITNLYSTKYHGATFAHACELLSKHDEIKVSPSALAKILYEQNITSPRTKKVTKRKIKKKIKEACASTLSKKKKLALEAELVALEDAHPRRPRCAFFGEMLQMDASDHLWFGSEKAQLHIAIDDSSSAILAAYFDKQETLNGYYNVLYQVLNDYGIPAMFYTDNRTVFEYHKNGGNKVENDTFTQFGYACHQLGIQLKTTSVPQAKGRVERAFQTLQQRLPIELRQAGITTIDEANVFLNHYIKEYNAKFALPINNTKTVFEIQPCEESILQILSVITTRKIDAGHCIKFNNAYYKTINSNGLQECFYKGTKATVIKTFDNRLICCINNIMYDMDKLEIHEKVSRNFSFNQEKDTPKKRNIPDAGHPWRNSNFLKYKNQKLTDDMLIA